MIPYYSEVIGSETARKDLIPTRRGKPATHREREPSVNGKVLGAGLEPACLSAYAPQTYVSAIPPPERECAKRTKFAVEVAPSQVGSGKLLLVPAAEVRLRGADVIVLNVTAEELAELTDFDDLRRLRARRGKSIFTIAPHPFYVLGASIGEKIVDLIDCFDAIELCHFHKGILNPNRRAMEVAARFGKPLIATSDAHQLHAFGRHYTSIPRPAALTVENVFTTLRRGPLRRTSPPASIVDLVSAFYFIFVAHPYRVRRQGRSALVGQAEDASLESKTQT